MSGIGRRGLIRSALGLPALCGFAGPALSAGSSHAPGPGGLLVLYRQSSAPARLFADRLRRAGLECRALQTDLVRQWRDGLEAEVAGADRMLLGMGDWMDFMLLRGLAAELRRFPLLSLQHPLRRQRERDWARRHAEELLALTRLEAPDLQRALEALARRETLPAEAPALFSWLLG